MQISKPHAVIIDERVEPEQVQVCTSQTFAAGHCKSHGRRHRRQGCPHTLQSERIRQAYGNGPARELMVHINIDTFSQMVV